MIELIAAAVTGAVVGGGVVWWQWPVDDSEWLKLCIDLNAGHDAHIATLTALRSNCFIPDERGVKVRYSDASVARRLKAETPKEVV